MAAGDVIEKKLTLKYDKGSFSFSKVALTAQNQALYNLAKAINSVQTDVCKTITKTETIAMF